MTQAFTCGRQAEQAQRYLAAFEARDGSETLRPHLHGDNQRLLVRPQAYYDSAKWRGTWEFDGGALMNQASHYVDLFDWLIGPVESVQAYVATLARNIQVEDTATVGVRWRSGALGSVNVTMLTYPKNLEGSITVIGEKGTVRIGGVAVNDIQHWEFDEPHPDDDKIRSANYETHLRLRYGTSALLRQCSRCHAWRSRTGNRWT